MRARRATATPKRFPQRNNPRPLAASFYSPFYNPTSSFFAAKFAYATKEKLRLVQLSSVVVLGDVQFRNKSKMIDKDIGRGEIEVGRLDGSHSQTTFGLLFVTYNSFFDGHDAKTHF